MSRRKQACPQHIASNDEDDLSVQSDLQRESKALVLDNEDEEEIEKPIDSHICENCKQEFLGLAIFVSHKRNCDKKTDNNETSALPQQEMIKENEEIIEELDEDKDDDKEDEDNYDEEDDEEIGAKFPQIYDKISNDKEEKVCESDNDSSENKGKQIAGSDADGWPLIGSSLSLSDTNVVIESLQNTSVAVAQHPPPSPDLMSQVPPNALQSTLFSLQQQQMMLFHVIHQLQSQIASTGGPTPQIPVQLLVPPIQSQTPPEVQTPDIDKSQPKGMLTEKTNSASFTQSNDNQTPKPMTPVVKTPPLNTSSIPPNLSSVSTGLDIINADDPADRPINPTPPLNESSAPDSPSEPNTLELLQRHTEQALQNTMSGGSFLLNGISGMGSSDFLSFRKTKDGKEDPMYRHRCKFCGKVFGSDSALQIHIRSHTGERPFKCNICGNRFTTKGNLKVHFQRHKAKYPHIKMNPHPVPEHLDKFHPPIEPPTGSQSPPLTTPPISMSGIPQMFPQSMSLNPTFVDTISPNAPKDMKGILSGNYREREPMSDSNSRSLSPREQPIHESLENCDSNHLVSDESDMDDREDDRDINEDKEMDEISDDEEAINLEKKSNHIISADDLPLNLQRIRRDVTEDEELNDDEDEDISGDEFDKDMDESERKEMADKNKENINSEDDRSDDSDDGMAYPPGAEFPYFPQFPPYFQSGAFPGIPTSLGLIPFGYPPGMPPIPTSGPNNSNPEGGEGSNPVFYQDLLPKPGSTDNTWETLMEVQKASETVKLQQLVDNIEHKLTDPNQCIICHRVLSCKSALQMHYRTHTGERPFKCKICGRAFTTKGNLKTHMGVHRVKPPLRILHQCPVCHKQFTNALVLQQHIRMHTGEPTDIPPEHIMANEIKGPSLMSPFQRGLMPPHFVGHIPPPAGLFVPPFMNGLTTSSSLNIPLSSPITSLPTMNPNMSLDLPSELKPEKTENKETPDCKRESVSPSESNRSSRATTPEPDSPNSASKHSKKARSRSPSPKSDVPLTPQAIPQPVIVSTPTPNPITPTSAAIVSSTKSNDSVNSSFSTSLAALENHVKTINSTIPQPMPFGPFGLGLYNLSQYQRIESEQNARLAVAANVADLSVHRNSEDKCSPNIRSLSPSSLNSKITDEISADERSTPDSSLGTMDRSSPPMTPTGGALDLTPKSTTKNNNNNNNTNNNINNNVNNNSNGNNNNNINKNNNNNNNNSNNSNDSTISKDNNQMTANIDSQFFPPPFAGLQFPTGRPNTTCRICLKTFACYSALEIHYRSHTKERPFKCDYCDRGFSTKGNMKQHSLTHKIRDLPLDCYTTTTTTPSKISTIMNVGSNESQSITNSSTTAAIANMSTNSDNSSCVSNSPTPNGNGTTNSSENRGEEGSPAEGSSKFNPKHVCRVCIKPFSSGSALQIHMRTHTGDKPFKCSICGRAFTTKGNLKVHMGTHMWSNGSSRRGRRMSIDLPNLHISPPKQLEFGPRSGVEMLMAHFN